MEKKCSRCEKPFNPNDKIFRSLDMNGNPLRADLCELCEIDDTIEETMKIKHISHEEAEKYLYKYICDKIYENTSDEELYNEDEIIDLWNKTPNISNVMLPNEVVRMIKDDE